MSVELSAERVDWHLWNWSIRHLSSRDNGSEYPDCAGGGICNDVWDFDREYDRMCTNVANTCDVVIDELPADYRAAVYATHLGGRWTLPDEAKGLYYRAAIPILGRGFARKGLE